MIKTRLLILLLLAACYDQAALAIEGKQQGSYSPGAKSNGKVQRTISEEEKIRLSRDTIRGIDSKGFERLHRQAPKAADIGQIEGI